MPILFLLLPVVMDSFYLRLPQYRLSRYSAETAFVGLPVGDCDFPKILDLAADLFGREGFVDGRKAEEIKVRPRVAFDGLLPERNTVDVVFFRHIYSMIVPAAPPLKAQRAVDTLVQKLSM